MSNKEDDDAFSSVSSWADDQCNEIVPYLNYETQVATFNGETRDENDEYRDKDEGARRKSSEENVRETQVYKNLNGEHCFILEAGATIQNLTIYKDSVATTKNESNAPGTSKSGEASDYTESVASNVYPEKSNPWRVDEYIVDDPLTPDSEVRTHFEEISEIPHDGKVDLRPSRDGRYPTIQEDNSRSRITPKGTNTSRNGTPEGSMSLVPLRNDTMNEYHTAEGSMSLVPWRNDTMNRYHTVPVEERYSGGNRYQLKYDCHMQPFPGIDEYRYHVCEHYVPVKIYRQYRTGGKMGVDPIELQDLFTREVDGKTLQIQSVFVVADCGKTAFCQYILHKYSLGLSAITALPFSSSLIFKVSLSKSLKTQMLPYKNRLSGMNLLLVVDDYDHQSKTQEVKLKKLLAREHAIYEAGANSMSILLTTSPFSRNSVLESFDSRFELSKFGEEEASNFITKFLSGIEHQNSDSFMRKIKTVVKDPIQDLNPLVLLSLCIIFQWENIEQPSEVLLRCKNMLAWRSQKQAWCRKSSLVTRSLRMHRLPSFHELKWNQLELKHCNIAKSILENSGTI